jgi:hypothetical protein
MRGRTRPSTSKLHRQVEARGRLKRRHRAGGALVAPSKGYARRGDGVAEVGDPARCSIGEGCGLLAPGIALAWSVLPARLSRLEPSVVGLWSGLW